MARPLTSAVRTGPTPKRCPIRGVFFHKGSGQYISYVGYHEKTIKGKHGLPETRRVRSTQYLGSDETKAIAKYFQIKAAWKDVVAAERKRYEERQAFLLEIGKSTKDRFKPNWPTAHGGTAADVKPWSQSVKELVEHFEQAKRDDPMKLTLVEGRDKYLKDYKAKIGLHNGQGINEYTYNNYARNLNLALALNPKYDRDRKPIDTSKTFENLKFEDYQAYVRFWCDPNVVKSGRTGLNYIRAFKQMLDGLKIKLPEGAEELFELRIARIAETQERREALELLRRVSERNEWGHHRSDIKTETLRQVVALLRADMPKAKPEPTPIPNAHSEFGGLTMVSDVEMMKKNKEG